MDSMRSRNQKLTSLFFFAGAILILIGEFIPWVSQQYSPWEIFIIRPIQISNSYVYIFPIIASLIVIIIGFLIFIVHNLHKGSISIVIFIALSLITIFLIQMFSDSGSFIFKSSGVFVGIAGYGIIFWGLFWMLIQEGTETSTVEGTS